MALGAGPGGLSFRRPDLEDLEAILALMNDPRSVHNRRGGRHAAHPEDPAQLYDRLAEDANLVVERSGALLGYASWQYFGAHAHLNVMAIAGASQRQGLGRALFARFREELLDQGARSYSLRAYTDSEWALAFYAGQGLTRYSDAAPLGAGTEGVCAYIAACGAHGEWPDPAKVLFYEVFR